MHLNRQNFTKEQFNRRLEQGHDVLANYYLMKYVDSSNKDCCSRKKYKKCGCKGVPLKGKLDKIRFDGKNANVVDYKTGDVEKAKR